LSDRKLKPLPPDPFRHQDSAIAPARDEYNTPPVEASETHAHIERKEFDKMLKVFPRLLRQMKACDAYSKCLENRDAGKVKHCYANDPRWREFFTHGW
jgi:hypothetical protein